MFVMLTGALFLNRRESLQYFFGRRLFRIAAPLAFWSVFWMAWLSQSGNAPDNWIVAIFKGPVIFHLWYFYMLLSMSILMPVFVRFYVNSTAKEIWLFIALWYFFCSVLPTVDPAHHIYGVDQSGVISVMGYSGFFLLGAALMDAKLDRSRAIAFGLVLFATGSALTIFLTRWHTAKLGHPSDFYYYYTSPAVVLASAGIFMAAVHWKRAPAPLHGFLIVLSDCSLGVYCLHLLTLDRLRAAFGFIGGPQNAWVVIPLSAALILLITAPIIYCVRMIKPLRSVA